MNLKISNYNFKQHKKIYRSTELFLAFIESHENLSNKNILDIGCGAGANTIYLAKKYPSSFFIGVDIDKKSINFAKSVAAKHKIKNCVFYNADFLKIKNIKKIDIAISFHVLSFTKCSYEKIIKKICKLRPFSMAHSSLFYEGLVETKITVDDFSKSELRHSPYNIISIPKAKINLKKNGYKFFKSKFMQLDINIKKKKHNGMASYTKKNNKGKNYIMSGPLILPHGYFYSSKN